MTDRNSYFAAAIVVLAMVVTSATSYMTYLESKKITKWEVKPQDVLNEIQDLRKIIEETFDANPQLKRPKE